MLRFFSAARRASESDRVWCPEATAANTTGLPCLPVNKTPPAARLFSVASGRVLLPGRPAVVETPMCGPSAMLHMLPMLLLVLLLASFHPGSALGTGSAQPGPGEPAPGCYDAVKRTGSVVMSGRRFEFVGGRVAAGEPPAGYAGSQPRHLSPAGLRGAASNAGRRRRLASPRCPQEPWRGGTMSMAGTPSPTLGSCPSQPLMHSRTRTRRSPVSAPPPLLELRFAALRAPPASAPERRRRWHPGLDGSLLARAAPPPTADRALRPPSPAHTPACVSPPRAQPGWWKERSPQSASTRTTATCTPTLWM